MQAFKVVLCVDYSSEVYLSSFVLHKEWVDWNRMRFYLGQFLYFCEKIANIKVYLTLAWVSDRISDVSFCLFVWMTS